MRQRILCASPAAIAGASSVAFGVATVSLVGGWHPAIARIALLVAVAANLGWLWIVALALNETVSPPRRPDSARFRVAVVFVAAYAAVLILAPNAPNRIAGSIWALGVLHLLAMGAALFALLFLAENLRLAETQRGGEAPPMAIPALLSSLGGMLAIQRRVNRVFADLCDRGASSR